MLGQSLFDECLELIRKWKPKKYSSEKEYENELRSFLIDELNQKPNFYTGTSRNINVKSQSGKSLCDLNVGNLIGIELKLGKKGKISQGEKDRLDGQCRRHTKEYPQGIIIVLVGDIDKYTFADIRETIASLDKLINHGGIQLYPYPLGLVNKSFNKNLNFKKQDNFEFNFRI